MSAFDPKRAWVLSATTPFQHASLMLPDDSGGVGGFLHMRVCLALIGGLTVSACATAPTTHAEWHRGDGRPVEPMAFQRSFLECRGQAAAAATNSPTPKLLGAATGQRNETVNAVLSGCMSQRGYVLVQIPNQ